MSKEEDRETVLTYIRTVEKILVLIEVIQGKTGFPPPQTLVLKLRAGIEKMTNSLRGKEKTMSEFVMAWDKVLERSQALGIYTPIKFN